MSEYRLRQRAYNPMTETSEVSIEEVEPPDYIWIPTTVHIGSWKRSPPRIIHCGRLSILDINGNSPRELFHWGERVEK